MRPIFDTHPLPLAVIDDAAVRHNVDSFAAYCERHGAELAPHVKTTMSPELFALQREAGAWGATVANVPQAQAVYGWGEPRLLIANQLADPASIEWVVETLEADETVEIYFWVDSVAGVELAARAHEGAGGRRPLTVLVEVGYDGGRGGCRGAAAAAEVATAVARSERLSLVGLAGFEGTIAAADLADRRAAVDRFLEDVRASFELLAGEGLFDVERPLVSAGGSAFFDLVVERLGGDDPPRQLLLRSGCYVTHDCGAYEDVSPLGGENGVLRPALEVWAPVLSVPEPALALLGLGRRDVSFDAGLPVPTKWRSGDGDVTAAPAGLDLFELNDQHAYVRDESGRLAVGDLVGVCISHPCTTFDKWRQLHLVNKDYEPIASITTCF
jgi:D-serine dehydratase